MVPLNPVGGQLASSTTLVDDGGLLAGNGTVAGNLIVGGGNGPESVLRPGFSVGHVEVIGDYQQGTNGTLAIETEGASPGETDTVSISGTAELGGTLSIDVSNFASLDPRAPLSKSLRPRVLSADSARWKRSAATNSISDQFTTTALATAVR